MDAGARSWASRASPGFIHRRIGTATDVCLLALHGAQSLVARQDVSWTTRGSALHASCQSVDHHVKSDAGSVRGVSPWLGSARTVGKCASTLTHQSQAHTLQIVQLVGTDCERAHVGRATPSVMLATSVRRTSSSRRLTTTSGAWVSCITR